MNPNENKAIWNVTPPKMWHNRLFVSSITVIIALLTCIDAAAVPNPLFPPNTNHLTIPNLQPHHLSTTNLTFLGPRCYHLLPATVDLEACSSLFDKIFAERSVAVPQQLYNGWRYMLPDRLCTLMIYSPNARNDRRVRISLAEVASHAIEVLRFCDSAASGSGSGGSYTFEGMWEVVVTKDPVKLQRGGVVRDQQ